MGSLNLNVIDGHDFRVKTDLQELSLSDCTWIVHWGQLTLFFHSMCSLESCERSMHRCSGFTLEYRQCELTSTASKSRHITTQTLGPPVWLLSRFYQITLNTKSGKSCCCTWIKSNVWNQSVLYILNHSWHRDTMHYKQLLLNNTSTQDWTKEECVSRGAWPHSPVKE